MKHIKTFEEKTKLKIGDYVICHTIAKYVHNSDETLDFIHNNVGKYVKYARSYDLKYCIKYENVPKLSEINLYDDLFWFDKYEIVDYSDNKEELEMKLAANKYNL